MGNCLSSVNKIRFALFTLVTVAALQAGAQCGLSSFNAFGGNLSPTSTFQASPGAGSGTYIDFNCSAGNIYSFYYSSLTDPNNNYDWDMTVSSTSSVIPYNNSLTPIPNSWTGGIGCPSSPRPASTEWYATYSGTVRINVKSWNGNCNDFVAGGGSAVVNYKVCPPTGDPGSGVNNWNVEAFVTADITIPQPNARYGSYVDNASGLNFNTQNYWLNTQTPANAPGWTGCQMPPENYVVRARRTGFPCNLYQIQALQGDDSVAIFLNGTQIFLSTSFNSTQNVGNYVLGANDQIEIREVATCGTNSVNVNFAPLGLPGLNAGTIGGVADNSFICQGTPLGNFTNVTSASGGSSGQPNGGTVAYDWQLSTDGGGTFTSVGVSTATWNSSTTVPPNAVYVVRRQASDACGTVVYSNTISVTGVATPNGSFTPSAQTICPGATATITLNLSPSASGPFNIIYSDGVNSFPVNGANDGDNISVTPLATSTYSYTSITDQYGCNRTSGFSGGALVLVAPAINVSAQIGNVLCNGGNTAFINVTASGGIGPLTYSDNGFGGPYQSSNVFNGLTIGTYNVFVKDSFGCYGSYGANPINITEPTALTESLTETDASCANVFDGSITITAGGGVAPYTYSINGGPTQPLNQFTGLQGGCYLVRVYDQNGCVDTASICIANTYIISVDTISTTNITCFGANDGSLQVQVIGGVPPYQYSINGITFQNSGSFTGLAAGTYIVIGRDSKGCTESVNVTISQPSQIVVVIDSITNVLCASSATGVIYIHATGGTPGYLYNWSNFENSQNDINLAGGSYSVTVTDSRGCTAVGGATVTSPYILSLNISTYSNPLCNNDSTGSIDLDANGGVPPYTFVWNNTSNFQSQTHLAAGNYTATVTDANGCTANISQVLTNPTPIVVNVTGTDVSCFGASDGSANLTVSGGTPGYTFQWSTFQASQNVSSLPGGLYYVIVTDNNGCQKRDSVQVNEPPVLAVSAVVTNVSCFNANDGAITLTVTGGTPNYTYNWTGGAQTQNLPNLGGGQYCVTVTDAHVCQFVACYTVVNPSEIIAGLIVKNVLCYGDSNGGINLVVSGGTPGYTYDWNNGAYSSQNLTNIPPGTYTLLITDSRGCTQVDTATVVSPGQLFTSGIIKNVSCNNLCDGQVLTTPYGGTLPYTYSWSSLQSTANIVQLCGGNYYLTLTDANNCSVISLYVVTNPPVLTAGIVAANATCPGLCNGSLSAIPAGGTTPYQYLWTNFSLDSFQTSVCAGHYTLLLTDSNNCRASAVADVTEPSAINITGAVTNVLCNGFNTGAINLTVTGGTPNYNYGWSNLASTASNVNLVAGNYLVTVTDANSCTMGASFDVTEPPLLHTTASINDPHCYGGNDAFVAVAVSGGTSPYVYNWSTSPSQVGSIATNLKPGTYTLTVTDANNCSSTITAFVGNPQQPVISTVVTPAHCYNTATGSVTGFIVNGNPPFSWEINGATQDSNVFHNLLPGNYIIEVTDANGCETTADFVVPAPRAITVTLTAPEQVILTGMSTQLVATTVTDTTIINYMWAPDTAQGASLFDFSGCADPSNCSSPYVKPPFTTTFTVTVMNADSCIASDTVTVYVKNEQSQFIPTAFTPNGDGMNDRFEFDILGASKIEVSIFDRWGERIYYNANQANGMSGADGWDGTKSGKDAPSDTYVYQMKVTYFDTTVKNKTGTVTLMR